MVLVISQKFFVVIFGINIISFLDDIILSMNQPRYQLLYLCDLSTDFIDLSDTRSHLSEWINIFFYVQYTPANNFKISP